MSDSEPEAEGDSHDDNEESSDCDKDYNEADGDLLYAYGGEYR
jgi:hypothetical protein